MSKTKTTTPAGKQCLTPECNGKPKFRGLCSACYLYARGMIARGVRTEEQLIRNGFMLSAGTRGPKTIRAKHFASCPE